MGKTSEKQILFKRFSYIQWICSIAVLFFFVVLFQMFLHGLVIIDKSDKPPWSRRSKKEILPPDMLVFKERSVLSFGNDVRVEPTKLLVSFQKEAQTSSHGFNTTMQRFGFRKPKLALVFADLLADPEQLLMVTVSMALLEIGYAIEVYSLEDGPDAVVVWIANIFWESKGNQDHLQR